MHIYTYKFTFLPAPTTHLSLTPSDSLSRSVQMYLDIAESVHGLLIRERIKTLDDVAHGLCVTYHEYKYVYLYTYTYTYIYIYI